MNKPLPQDGGSYRRNPDGSLTQLSPTTGERPCKCRPESVGNADPAARAVPLVGLGVIADLHDAAESADPPQSSAARRKAHLKSKE